MLIKMIILSSSSTHHLSNSLKRASKVGHERLLNPSAATDDISDKEKHLPNVNKSSARQREEQGWWGMEAERDRVERIHSGDNA